MKALIKVALVSVFAFVLISNNRKSSSLSSYITDIKYEVGQQEIKEGVNTVVPSSRDQLGEELKLVDSSRRRDLKVAVDEGKIIQDINGILTNNGEKTDDDDDNNNNNNKQEKQKQKKLTFIIHVGPSKTATSTIQQECVDYGSSLKEDRYYYIGRPADRSTPLANQRHWEEVCMKSSLYNMLAMSYDKKNGKSSKCFNEWERLYLEGKRSGKSLYEESRCYRKMKDELQEYYQQGYNVIMSDEKMNWIYSFKNAYHRESYFNALHELFRDNNNDDDSDSSSWNVKIVIAYRRHAEWALSAWKEQEQKYTGCFGRDDPRSYQWPHRGRGRGGGKVCSIPWTRLVEWQQGGGRYHRNSTRTSVVYIDESVQLWKSYNFSTHILNFHHPNRTIPQLFFCDILQQPQAPRTCQIFEQQSVANKVNSNSNSISKFHYDTIAVAAYQRGWIDATTTTSRTRSDILQELTQYHNDILNLTVSHLPFKCPTQQQLEEYLQLGLQKELELLPDFFDSPQGRSQHEAQFWNLYRDQKSFCVVDTTRLFENCTSWDQVKEQLRNRTSWPVKPLVVK